MRATGIVRRVDDIGRIVIPREIRNSMGISEGDLFEIFIDSESNGLVLVPYRAEITSKLKGIAENLSALGATPEHCEIAKKIKKIAKELEQLEK